VAQALPKFRLRDAASRLWRGFLALLTFLWVVAPSPVRAEEAEVNSLVFLNPSIVVRTGEQASLPDLVAKYASGDTRAVTAEAEYEVADPGVARVEVSEGSARLAGLTAGHTKLTARYAGREAALFVFVSDPPPEVRWQKAFEVAPSEFLHVVALPDGSFLAVGTVVLEGKVFAEILRVAEGGEILWKRDERVADAATYPTHAAIGSDGKVYVVGYAEPKDENPFTWVLAVGAEDGAILGERRLGGGDVVDFGRGVLPLADGGFVVASSRYTDAAESSVHLWRIDALGNVRWEKDYRGETRTLIDRKGLALSANGDIFVAGKALKAPGSNVWDGFLLRVRPEDGSVLWNATFGGEKNDFPYDVVATSDGGALVVGTTTSYPPHNAAAFLRKFDKAGKEEWVRIFGAGAGRAFWAFDVAAFPDGSGYVFVGPAMLGSGNYAHTVVRVDEAGNLQWLAQLGGVRVDHTYGVAINAKGAIAVAGRGTSFHEDNQHHAFLALFAAEGRPSPGEEAPPSSSDPGTPPADGATPPSSPDPGTPPTDGGTTPAGEGTPTVGEETPTNVEMSSAGADRISPGSDADFATAPGAKQTSAGVLPRMGADAAFALLPILGGGFVLAGTFLLFPRSRRRTA